MEYLIILDKKVLFWIQQHLVSSVLTSYMIGLSKMGNAGIIWIIFGRKPYCWPKGIVGQVLP